MSQDKCNISLNGVEVEARPGQMLIEVTDATGVYVPRFCYHSKLSVAANCRMCLVEVENAPKPLPACATPVTPGMKVQTRSAKAIGAQKAIMEFLLINHPLDCPICDQGGECELQDLAMGYGRDVSRYTERKRVVKDKDIGPLVSTDMTRCIQCTRCVRFTEEIAGLQELGTIGRSDRLEISTYIERSVNHELSGNIIDICPVGALNNKPFRFSARAWEMTQHSTIAPHDCVGSHLYAHVMEDRVKRVVPEACEEINETWISDRDRFSYEGIHSADRVQQPMVRDDSGWRAGDWNEAFDTIVGGIQAGPGAKGGTLGALVSPSTTLEEGYLLTRLMAQLGSADLDHRLRRRDFRTQETDPRFPWLGMAISDVERLEQVLIVGSNLRKEVPLLAHRVRKAARGGAGVHFLNPARFPYLFPVTSYLEGSAADFWLELGTLVRAAAGKGAKLPAAVAEAASRSPAATDHHRQIVTRLRDSARAAIFMGQISLRHPRQGDIELLAAELAKLTGASLGYLPEGANAAGLALAGVLPHRDPGGRPRPRSGKSAQEIVESPPGVVLLYGVEPELDCAGGEKVVHTLSTANLVVAFSPFMSESLRRLAHVVLPIATFAETSGTFVNCEGRWQSFAAAVRPSGESRPGWKVLRVLGNRLGVADCDYPSSEAIRDELRQALGDVKPDNCIESRMAPTGSASGAIELADLDVPMYQIDSLVRRARSLQLTQDGLTATARPAERRRA